jgi:hypothetical protein
MIGGPHNATFDGSMQNLTIIATSPVPSAQDQA